MAQRVKHLPAMWETWVQSLGGEEPLEKEMATHSSILAWKPHGRRSLVSYSPWSREELDTTEQLHFHALEQEMAAHLYGTSLVAWWIRICLSMQGT